ncbi:uncharacterized protein LOC115051861 isoform X3 [Echeneis naucrates]|uniref:uncharacterized protein LOC115051861 isoform X3 n=1 Tax=Echeneis naucrates TaxID=173247 RepID=UPI001113B4AB|nr:uncharacterized protein LOC115051861 isoform X3 [Echeneis naucrates]
MKFCSKVVLLLFLVSGTLTEEGFDLFDALDPEPTQALKEQPKAPEKPKTDGFDLFDALYPEAPKEQPKAPGKPKTDDFFGFDLADALEPDVRLSKKPKKPSFGDFDDFDLGDALKTGFDLFDAPDSEAPKEQPKAPGKPETDDCQGNLVHKLDTVIENQRQQLRLLRQLVALSSGPSYNQRLK